MARAVISVKQQRNLLGGGMGVAVGLFLNHQGLTDLALMGYFIGLGLAMLGANVAHGLEDAAYEAHKKR